MSAPRFAAWRFNLADHDGDAPGLAIANRGGVGMVDGDASIRQAILLLLSTRPGERVMRPEYGCDLQRVAFMPNDETTAGLAIHQVRRALLRWEPRIDILAIDALNEEEPSRLEITIDYRVRATLRRDLVAVSMSLNGGSRP